MLDREIENLKLDVEIRMDELVADQLPDDLGHLVAVQLDDRMDDLDLGHRRGSWWERDEAPYSIAPPAVIGLL